MSLIFDILLAIWTPTASQTPDASPAAAVNPEEIEIAARAWLTHIDKGDWPASHAASGTAFRSAISATAWGQAVAAARRPVGQVMKRELVEHGSQSAPRPMRIVIFRTDFADRAGATETVALEREGGEYRVVGYSIK